MRHNKVKFSFMNKMNLFKLNHKTQTLPEDDFFFSQQKLKNLKTPWMEIEALIYSGNCQQ